MIFLVFFSRTTTQKTMPAAESVATTFPPQIEISRLSIGWCARAVPRRAGFRWSLLPKIAPCNPRPAPVATCIVPHPAGSKSSGNADTARWPSRARQHNTRRCCGRNQSSAHRIQATRNSHFVSATRCSILPYRSRQLSSGEVERIIFIRVRVRASERGSL